MLLGKGSVWAFLSVATTLAVAAATSFRSTASASLTVKHLLKKVAADTNLNFGQHIHDEREGVQQLYLSLLRSVHAHRALPYHSGDVWGGSRGQLDRHAIDKFLRKTSRHVPDNVRCLEWGVRYIDEAEFSTKCKEKWSFEYTSEEGHLNSTGHVLHGSLDRLPQAVLGSLMGYFDVIMCTQVFEHVDHPFWSAQTLAKLLAPDGLLFFTVPFISRYHIGHIKEDPRMPQDQYRYTLEGVRKLWRHTESMEIIEQYASGRSLLTHAHIDGFGSQDFSQEELDGILYDANKITVGGHKGGDDLYFQINILLKKKRRRRH